MSNTKYTSKERQDFKMRLAVIEMLIPDKYSEIIHKETKISKDIIKNVRHGRTINKKVLKALEALCKAEAVTK